MNPLDVLFGPALYGIVFLYAPFMSFRAINTPSPDDDKQWLTFWVSFSAVQAAESMLEITHLSDIIPFYLEIKFALVIFLLAGGASKVYDLVVSPVFSLLESKFDKDDLKLLDEDPSLFIKKHGARAYEKAKESAMELKGKATGKINDMKNKKET